MDLIHDYPNRSLCSVLEAMRDCHKTRNFSYLLGLIEEAQYLASRMEAGLGDKRDVKYWVGKKAEMKKEIRELEAKIKGLNNATET